MILIDVNVLVAGFREDHAHHHIARPWLLTTLGRSEPVAMVDSVLVAMIRLVTSRRVFLAPSPLDEALTFARAVRSARAAMRVVEGDGFFGVFADLCVDTRVTGSSIPDAALAALAVEQGATLATFDRGFVRFAGLSWIDLASGEQRRNFAR